MARMSQPPKDTRTPTEKARDTAGIVGSLKHEGYVPNAEDEALLKFIKQFLRIKIFLQNISSHTLPKLDEIKKIVSNEAVSIEDKCDYIKIYLTCMTSWPYTEVEKIAICQLFKNELETIIHKKGHHINWVLFDLARVRELLLFKDQSANIIQKEITEINKMYKKILNEKIGNISPVIISYLYLS